MLLPDDMQRILRTSIGIISVGLLSACVDMTNMALTGAQAVYNRRSITNNFTDHYITMQAYQSLYMRNDDFKGTHIVIATYNGEVLLTGQTPLPEQKRQAASVVKRIAGIKNLYNLIEIENPSSAVTKMSDSWLTTKVKAKLIASEDVDASRIKVVTENGTVYLMGILGRPEAEEASAIAAETEGVRRVVKIFSYATISKKLPGETDRSPSAS